MVRSPASVGIPLVPSRTMAPLASAQGVMMLWQITALLRTMVCPARLSAALLCQECQGSARCQASRAFTVLPAPRQTGTCPCWRALSVLTGLNGTLLVHPEVGKHEYIDNWLFSFLHKHRGKKIQQLPPVCFALT